MPLPQTWAREFCGMFKNPAGYKKLVNGTWDFDIAMDMAFSFWMVTPLNEAHPKVCVGSNSNSNPKWGAWVPPILCVNIAPHVVYIGSAPSSGTSASTTHALARASSTTSHASTCSALPSTRSR